MPTTAISGVIVTLITEGLKKIPGIPVNDGEKAKIRTIVVILSLVCGVVVSYLDGSLATSGAVAPLVDSVTSWIYSTVFYHGAVR